MQNKKEENEHFHSLFEAAKQGCFNLVLQYIEQAPQHVDFSFADNANCNILHYIVHESVERNAYRIVSSLRKRLENEKDSTTIAKAADQKSILTMLSCLLDERNTTLTKEVKKKGMLTAIERLNDLVNTENEKDSSLHADSNEQHSVLTNLVNSKNKKGNTPIMEAVKKNNLDAFYAMKIIKGVDFKTVDEDDRTMLHFAVLSGNLEIATFLLRAVKLSHLKKDKNQITPLDLAKELKSYEGDVYDAISYEFMFFEKFTIVRLSDCGYMCKKKAMTEEEAKAQNSESALEFRPNYFSRNRPNFRYPTYKSSYFSNIADGAYKTVSHSLQMTTAFGKAAYSMIPSWK